MVRLVIGSRLATKGGAVISDEMRLLLWLLGFDASIDRGGRRPANQLDLISIEQTIQFRLPID